MVADPGHRQVRQHVLVRGQPVELAPIYVLLASQEGSYLNGEVFGATGGKGVDLIVDQVSGGVMNQNRRLPLKPERMTSMNSIPSFNAPLEAIAPISREAFRDGMAKMAAAVNIITTDGPAGRAGFAATAVCSVTDSPATLLICLTILICDFQGLTISRLSKEPACLSGRYSSSNC